jgi:hypothetical protein
MRGQELADRLRFDYRILADMRCATFDFQAHRTSWDLENRANPITPDEDTANARKYRFILRVPTLVAPGAYAAVTEIGVDTDVVDYPDRAPNAFVLSNHVPWSPHFHHTGTVCIGQEFWENRAGHVVLGDLVVHLQRALNWDEKGRGSGYSGWNEDAIQYHGDALDNNPLDTSVVYAVPPNWLGHADDGFVFEVQGRDRPDYGFEVLR